MLVCRFTSWRRARVFVSPTMVTIRRISCDPTCARDHTRDAGHEAADDSGPWRLVASKSAPKLVKVEVA